jgi:hypothetical protein
MGRHGESHAVAIAGSLLPGGNNSRDPFSVAGGPRTTSRYALIQRLLIAIILILQSIPNLISVYYRF